MRLEPGGTRSKQNLRLHPATSRWSKLEILVYPAGRPLALQADAWRCQVIPSADTSRAAAAAVATAAAF